MSSNLRKVTELDESALDADARAQIERLVASGRSRDHLVINARGKVLFDPDLASEDGYNKERIRQQDKDQE